MTLQELNRLRRERRYLDGDCTECGLEPRGDGALGAECRERNNRRRRNGRPSGRPKGSAWTVRQIRAFRNAHLSVRR